MTFVAGAFVMLLSMQKINKERLIWLAAGAFAMESYFFHYTKPSAHPEIIKPLLENPTGFLGYVFSFLGGAFTEKSNYAIAIGVSLALVCLFLTYKKQYKENPTLFAFAVFILITSVLAALTRFGFGLEQSLSSKYTISSAVLAATCYVAVVPYVFKKLKPPYLGLLTALALYFHFDTYKKYLPAKEAEKIEFEKNYALVTAGELSDFNFGWTPMDHRKEMPRQLLKQADSIGYLKFKFKDEGEILNAIPSDTSKTAQYKLERFEQAQANAIVLSGWAFVKNVNPAELRSMLCFRDQSGKAVKYLYCQKYSRQDVTQANAADKTNYDQSGFFTFFNPKEVQPGNYLLEIILTDSKYKVVIKTGQTLTMQ